ncbi:MAG: hypothetical protein M0D55_14580 [Elusimicrobiota bacterium]|nr:MAG: hypothetical protein M0D55_14580 [Elusimicrobiota bacterium]
MIAIFALAAALAGSAAAGEPVKNAKTIAQDVAAAVRHAAPKGWERMAYANGSDPVLRYSKNADEFIIKIYGGKDSAYATAAEFPAGTGGAKRRVAGREVEFFERRFPLAARDPHGASSPASPEGTETLGVLPLKGKRFAVVSWRRSSPAPDLEGAGEKAWGAFLKSIKP